MDLLAELERVAEAFGPPFEEARARLESLPPSERREVVALFGALALDVADRQRENRQRAAFAASSAEAIREAQERERAAGRPVDPAMTLGDALENPRAVAPGSNWRHPAPYEGRMNPDAMPRIRPALERSPRTLPSH